MSLQWTVPIYETKKLKLIRNVGYCTILIINNEATQSFQSRCQKNALAGRVHNICRQGQNIYVKPAHIQRSFQENLA